MAAALSFLAIHPLIPMRFDRGSLARFEDRVRVIVRETGRAPAIARVAVQPGAAESRLRAAGLYRAAILRPDASDDSYITRLAVIPL